LQPVDAQICSEKKSTFYINNIYKSINYTLYVITKDHDLESLISLYTLETHCKVVGI